MQEYKVLSVRLTAEDYARLFKVAEGEHLKASTWVKQLALRAIEDAEGVGGSPINAPESVESLIKPDISAEK